MWQSSFDVNCTFVFTRKHCFIDNIKCGMLRILSFNFVRHWLSPF